MGPNGEISGAFSLRTSTVIIIDELSQTTASCDGKLKIYDMSGSEPLHLKTMEGIIGSSESE